MQFYYKKLLLYIQDQNSPTKQFEGVIIRKGYAIKNTTNLPKIL